MGDSGWRGPAAADVTTATSGETVESGSAVVVGGFGVVPGYRDVRQLGSGRTGRVFLATYQETGAYVAIKYLNATLRRDDDFMTRYRQDAVELVEIDHPHVVRVHEYVETPRRAAVVMELVDGVSLREILRENVRVSPEAALVAARSALEALAAAHERGVAHRDVRPENLLVQADGTAKLTDFGIVTHVEEPDVPAGSPPYMAPELWTRGDAGPLADLYAVACLLFEAVRGRAPYRGEDVPVLRDQHLVEPVPLEVVPDALRGLLRRGLAKAPALRYASAREFLAELERDAAAGYGPEWEQRGRRHLAEPATALALRFPLARTERDPIPRPAATARPLPAVPPYLWLAVATVVAVAISLLASGGTLPPGPATALMPPDTPTAEEPADTAPPATEEPSTAGPEPDRSASAPPGESRRPTASPESSRRPRPDPTVSDRPTASRTSAPPRGPATVTGVAILSWNGSTGSVRVTTGGTGAVRLRLSYLRREDGGVSREVAAESRTLSGRTAYTSQAVRDLGQVACGRRAHLTLVAMTEPAAANGPQISEATVDGPACASPSQPTPEQTPSPDGQAALGVSTPWGTSPG
ncbi:protein kinase [Nonomuraea sp. NPDC048826]|uniref:serine/threonine-protein kinase n=1 Tax=Nonomuraea sp. NPDC048826 TaxID=3364347 RepID=UPI003719FCB1